MTAKEKPKPTKIPHRHQIVTMRIADLVPWESNPRRISETALAGLDESISRFGCVEPIIFNKRSTRVVGGHQRLCVLRAHGVEHTEVVVVDLPEVEERALNLALNNPYIAGGWTPEVRALLDDLAGFKVLPKRWIVERTFGWLGRRRRLSKDYEQLTETSETVIRVAMIGLMARRLAAK